MMFSGEQNDKEKMVVEENYRGKMSEGRVTVTSDMQCIVDKVDEGFSAKGFRVRYVSESSMEAKKDFDMSKPFQRIGGVEISFFHYDEQVVVYYKVDNLLGLSYITLAILIIYTPMALSWLYDYGNSPGIFSVIEIGT